MRGRGGKGRLSRGHGLAGRKPGARGTRRRKRRVAGAEEPASGKGEGEAAALRSAGPRGLARLCVFIPETPLRGLKTMLRPMCGEGTGEHQPQRAQAAEPEAEQSASHPRPP